MISYSQEQIEKDPSQSLSHNTPIPRPQESFMDLDGQDDQSSGTPTPTPPLRESPMPDAQQTQDLQRPPKEEVPEHELAAVTSSQMGTSPVEVTVLGPKNTQSNSHEQFETARHATFDPSVDRKVAPRNRLDTRQQTTLGMAQKPGVRGAGHASGGLSEPPRSSYYYGPPSLSAAYGTDPIGTIGVHHPREIIRVERDYEHGELCQFSSAFPLELEGRLTPTQFLETINAINEILISAHSVKAAFIDNMLAIFSLYLSTFLRQAHYDKEMKRLEHLIEDENTQLYHERGLHILWPRRTAFLFLEIEYYVSLNHGVVPIDLSGSVNLVAASIKELPEGKMHDDLLKRKTDQSGSEMVRIPTALDQIQEHYYAKPWLTIVTDSRYGLPPTEVNDEC